VFTVHTEMDLKSPVLIMQLRGWIDAGTAAQMAMDAIVGQLELTTMITFDDDAFIDYRSRRPTMDLDDGLLTQLIWPHIEISGGRALHRDVIVLRGAEPDRHWRPFASAVVDVAEKYGVTRVLGLGAYPGPVPHTRPTSVVSTASSRELADAIGHNQTRMEVPAGVQAAIEVEAASRGIEAATIWAPVPHYVATMDYPEAAAALVDAVAQHGGLELDSGTLRDAANATRSRIDALIDGNTQHIEMLRAMEIRADEMAENRDLAVPNADDLAREIEEFLRSED
jgi:proteasome assembly chaperone (PAC2) family protein